MSIRRGRWGGDEGGGWWEGWCLGGCLPVGDSAFCTKDVSLF